MIAIKLTFKINSIFLLCNLYLLQTKDKRNKEGIYEASPTVKESIKIPDKIAAIEDIQGELVSENGSRKITGQQGIIPFILSQSRDDIIKNGKQIEIKKINSFLFVLTIIF